MDVTQAGFPTDEDRLRRQFGVLLELSKQSGRSDDLRVNLDRIASAAAQALDVERCGVWLLSECRKRLECQTVHVSSIGQFRKDPDLVSADYPNYFAALDRELVIDAGDAAADPRTSEFRDGYLRPQGITSMLDVPIRVGGEVVGTVCFEHTAAPRTWRSDEIAFAHSIAELVTVALEADRLSRSKAESQRWQNRFWQVLDNATDMLVGMSESGTISSMNRTFRTYLGRSRREWLGRRLDELIDPRDRSLFAELCARRLAGEEVAPADLRFLAEDGDARVLEVEIAPSTDPSQSGFLVVGRDASRRHAAEQRTAGLIAISREISSATNVAELLARVARSLRVIVPCDMVVITYRDPDVNHSRVVAHDGIPENAVQAIEALRFRPGQFRPEPIDSPEPLALQADSSPEISELFGRFGVGSALTFPLYYDDLMFGGVTILSRGHEAFDLRSRETCDGAIRQLSRAIEALERQARIREEGAVNAALARVGQEMISSLDTSELLDRLCRITADVLTCDTSQTYLWLSDERRFAQVASFGGTRDTEAGFFLRTIDTDAVRDSGEAFARDGIATVVANDGSQLGELLGRIGIQHGIAVAIQRGNQIVGAHTASRRADIPFTEVQRRIVRGIGHLASMALANASLVEKLERANRVKSEFVATMSHELRTPLNVIIGYTDLIAEGAYGPLHPDQELPLSRIAVSARDLVGLVNATLDLNRLELGRATLELRNLTIATLVDEVAASTEEVRTKDNVTFAWRIPEPDRLMRVDAEKLKTILHNLIGNAMKFTDAGSVVVTIEASADSLALEVRDTGPGIAPEMRQAIFESFRQVDGSSTRRHGGVGLGLHIVQRLVDFLGGSLDLESEVGRGSCFRIRVPTYPID